MPTTVHALLCRLPTWALLGIASTSGLCFGLGAPPEGLTALIWLGFVPLVLVLRVTADRGWRRAFWTGLSGGVCVGLVGFPWIAQLIVTFTEVPWVVGALGLIAFSIWTAIPFGLWAVGFVLGPQRGWQRWAWPIVLWIALAAVWPHLFPYTPMIGFAEAPAWMQAAELAGVAAVEAQVLGVGLLLSDALLTEARGPRLIRGALGVAIPVLSTALGSVRLAAVDAEAATARRVRIGIVQPNNALMTEDPTDRLARLHTMSVAAQAEGAQMIVWPEAGAFPYAIERPFRHDFTRTHRRILRGYRLPTIFGAGSYAKDEEWERNSVFNMAADGTVRGRFDKTILVPIGEYVPIVDPSWVREHVPAVSHNIAGEGPVRFEVDPSPTPERPDPGPPLFVGPLVCYEDIFPDFARRVAAQPGGIDLFVNVTIDTWFGVTAEPWEHLALAQFRSVEHRIPMVRSVSAGVSASIDAGGRLVAHLPVTGPTAEVPVPPQRLVTDVALPRNTAQQPTIYARAGWLVPWACQAWVVLVLAMAALARLRGRPYKRPSEADPEAS